MHRYRLIPDVTAVLAQNQVVSDGAAQLIQCGADPVKYGFQSIEWVCTAFFFAPEQIDQIAGSDGVTAAIDHIRQQQPDLLGTIGTVGNGLFIQRDGKLPQHPNGNRSAVHTNSLLSNPCRGIPANPHEKPVISQKDICGSIPQSDHICNEKRLIGYKKDIKCTEKLK